LGTVARRPSASMHMYPPSSESGTGDCPPCMLQVLTPRRPGETGPVVVGAGPLPPMSLLWHYFTAAGGMEAMDYVHQQCDVLRNLGLSDPARPRVDMDVCKDMGV
jgi:hypothetical protein